MSLNDETILLAKHPINEQQLSKILLSQQWQYNLSGQVDFLLTALPHPVQEVLACDYTGRLYTQGLLTCTLDDGFFLVQTLRQYLLGHEVLHDIIRLRDNFFDSYYPQQNYPQGKILVIIIELLHVCVQRELERAGVMVKHRYKPSVSKLVRNIRVTIAQYKMDAVPSLASQQMLYRKHRQQLIHEEAQWQREYMMKFISRSDK